MSNIDVIPAPGLPDDATPIAIGLPGPAATADHAVSRNRRIIASISSALLIKPLALLTPLVTAPLFVTYLGRERYGLFESIVAMAQLLSLTNAGLTLGLLNRLIDCNVTGDRLLARRYVSSLSIVLTGLVLIVAAVWTGLSATVNWSHIFKTTDPQALHQMPWVVWISGLAVAAGLLFSLPIPIFQAYQDFVVANVWDGITKVATFIACVAVVATPWGLIGVALAVTVVPVLVAAASTVYVFLRRPWLRPHLHHFDRRLVRSTLTDGALLFLLQTSILLLYQCDKMVIGIGVDLVSVTQYALLGRLFIVAYGVFMVLLNPLWPAHGEAIRRGDWRWVTRSLRLSLVAGITVSGGCGIILLLFGDTIFRVWTRGQVTHVSASLICAMTATFVLRAWVDCRTVILNSDGVLLPQVYFFCAHAALNLAVAVWASKHYGVLGVAWATPITALLTTAWGYPWLMRRAARRHRAAVA